MRASLASNVRPLKFAYFIDDDDLDRFIGAVRFCCSQWGGIRNFIVPVKTVGVDGWFRGLLSQHPPDVVVRACSRRTDLQDGFCRHHLEPAMVRDWDGLPGWDPGVRILSLYSELGVDSAAVPDPSRPILHEYEPGPDWDTFHQACALAAFGTIVPAERPSYEARFQLLPANLVVAGDPFVDHQFRTDPLASPINLTATSLTRRGIWGASAECRFEVVLASTVWELCWFWSKRAVTDATVFAGERRTLLMPPAVFGQPAAREQLFRAIRRAIAQPQQLSSVAINFIVYEGKSGQPYLAIRESEEAGLIRQHPDQEPVTTQWRSGAPLGEPLVYQLNVRSSSSGTYREGVSQARPKPTEMAQGVNHLVVPPHPPLPHGGGAIALDVESDLWDRFARSSSLAHSIHSDSRFTHYGLTTFVPSSQFETELAITLPPELAAIQMYFADRGYQAELTTTGKQAQIFIDLVGGITGCNRLRDPGMCRLIQVLTSKPANKMTQEIRKFLRDRVASISEADQEAIADKIKSSLAEADVMATLGRAAYTLEHLKSEERLKQFRGQILSALDDLVARSVVYRGFHMSCGQCGTRSWFPLGTVDEQLVCPGCFFGQPLSATVDGKERAWEYSLNTAVNAALEQDALVPILLLAKISTEQPGIFAPAINLALKRTGGNNAIGDFDVVYVKRGAVYAGECKAGRQLGEKAGRQLGEKDIDLARLARDTGCAGFHFASLEGFDEESLAMIESLRQEPGGAGAHFEIFVHNRSDLLLP